MKKPRKTQPITDAPDGQPMSPPNHTEAERVSLDDLDLRDARQRLDDFVSLCRELFKQHSPDFWEVLTHLSLNEGRMVMMDCKILDVAARAAGDSTRYVKERTDFLGVEESMWLAGRTYDTFDKWISAAKKMKQNGTTPGSWLLTQGLVRLLSDGWSAGYVLKIFAEGIAERAKEGDARFFSGLPPILDRQRVLRKPGEWIERLWLPLRLWECRSDPGECLKRFNHAAGLLPGMIQPMKREYDIGVAMANVIRTRNAAVPWAPEK